MDENEYTLKDALTEAENLGFEPYGATLWRKSDGTKAPDRVRLDLVYANDVLAMARPFERAGFRRGSLRACRSEKCHEDCLTLEFALPPGCCGVSA